jgi:hypothetical protein
LKAAWQENSTKHFQVQIHQYFINGPCLYHQGFVMMCQNPDHDDGVNLWDSSIFKQPFSIWYSQNCCLCGCKIWLLTLRNEGWGFSRTGCCGGYLGLRGIR